MKWLIVVVLAAIVICSFSVYGSGEIEMSTISEPPEILDADLQELENAVKSFVEELDRATARIVETILKDGKIDEEEKKILQYLQSSQEVMQAVINKEIEIDEARDILEQMEAQFWKRKEEVGKDEAGETQIKTNKKEQQGKTKKDEFSKGWTIVIISWSLINSLVAIFLVFWRTRPRKYAYRPKRKDRRINKMGK